MVSSPSHAIFSCVLSISNIFYIVFCSYYIWLLGYTNYGEAGKAAASCGEVVGSGGWWGTMGKAAGGAPPPLLGDDQGDGDQHTTPSICIFRCEFLLFSFSCKVWGAACRFSLWFCFVSFFSKVSHVADSNIDGETAEGIWIRAQHYLVPPTSSHVSFFFLYSDLISVFFLRFLPTSRN
jgi:hypothetical protein